MSDLETRLEGVRLCGPSPATPEDLTIVGNFNRWLQGARDVWDDEGNDVTPITQGE